jgi:hypothetical protein
VEGIAWQQAEKLAQDEHENYREENALVDKVTKTLERQFLDTDGTPVALKDMEYIRLNDILELMDVRPVDIKRVEAQAADALSVLGYKKGRRRVAGVSRPVWVKKAA